MDIIGFLNSSGWLSPALWAVAVVVTIALLRASNMFRYIPNNQVGIVEKLWTTKGSIKSGFIACTVKLATSRKCCAAACM